MGKESLFPLAVLIPERQMIDGCATDEEALFLLVHERYQLLETVPKRAGMGCFESDHPGRLLGSIELSFIMVIGTKNH